MQVIEGESVLHSLAMLKPWRVGDFRKLAMARVVGGEICGEWCENTENGNGYWNPFDTYYGDQRSRPYEVLSKCGTNDTSIVAFVGAYGPVGHDRSHDRRKGCFNIADFKLERFRFRFAMSLGGLRNRGPLLRRVVREAADLAWASAKALPRDRGKWGMIIKRYCDAARFDWPGEDWYDKICVQIIKAGEDRLVSAAQFYIAAEIAEQTKGLRLTMTFPLNGGPRLLANCPDLLTAFYWMLARDWEAGGAPLTCANCGDFFHSLRKGATYCMKQRCKVQGRKRLDWERNRAKYNQTRNRKLRRLRRLRKGAQGT
jgi:hypothetical protein